MTSFDRLMQHVVAEQDARDERAELDRVRDRLREGRPAGRRRTRPRWQAPLVAAAVSAAAVTAVLGWRALAGDPLTFRVGESGAEGVVGQWIAARSTDVALRFSDGGEMTLLRGTRGRVVSLEARRAEVLVESGRLGARIVPGTGVRWRVVVGPFDIAVTGTRFEVYWAPDEDDFELVLHEGGVMIAGCAFGAGYPVRAGETVRASCAPHRFEVSRPPTDPSAAPAEPARAGPAPEGEPEAAEPPALAEPARAATARADGASAEGFEAECRRAGAARLIQLGDTARFGGRLDQARHAYLTLRRRFPQRPEAADAAFRLGRMEFDQRHAYAEAASWLAAYLRERPGGALAQEARGRLMEALHRAGDRDGARRAAGAYLASHPGGPHAKLAALLAQGEKPGE